MVLTTQIPLGNEKSIELTKPDVDWNDLTQSVVRAPQILRNKFTSTEKITDPEFDKIVENIKGLDKQFDNLESTLKKHRVSICELLKHCVRIGSIFKDFADPTSNGSEAVTRQQINMFDRTSVYLDQYKSLQPGIEEELKIFEDRVSGHLKNVSKYIKYANKAIKERHYSNLDYQKYSQESRTLNSKTDLSLKEHKRKFEVLKKLDDARGKYELLNDRLKMELPVFMLIISKIMGQIFTMVYYSTFNIFTNLSNASKLLTNEFTFDLKDELEDSEYQILRDDFHQLQDPIVTRIENLDLINFHQIALNKLQQRVLETTVHTQTCKALYDFKGVELGDLSFSAGDTIKIVDRSDPGWWRGTSLKDGNTGIFPYNYVQLNE